MTKFKYLVENYETVEQLKKAYYKLAIKLHGDITGDGDEAMKQLNNEYEILFNRVKDIEENESGYTTTSEKRAEYITKYINIINKLITLDNLIIDVVGDWLWVYGDTRPVKETLKELKFQWSRSKKKWYYADYLKGYKRGSKKTYDEIIEKYGQEQYTSKGAAKLQ